MPRIPRNTLPNYNPNTRSSYGGGPSAFSPGGFGQSALGGPQGVPNGPLGFGQSGVAFNSGYYGPPGFEMGFNGIQGGIPVATYGGGESAFSPQGFGQSGSASNSGYYGTPGNGQPGQSLGGGPFGVTGQSGFGQSGNNMPINTTRYNPLRNYNFGGSPQQQRNPRMF